MNERRSWDTFLKALEDHFGTLRRAQTNFSVATGYGISTIQHWRQINSVPAEAFVDLMRIDPEKYPTTLFEGHHPIGFVERIIELSNSGSPNLEIARLMSREFGKTVTENMVKGVRFRNKERIKDYSSRHPKKKKQASPNLEEHA